MATTKTWMQAFRLRTLPLAISCILTGSFLALLQGEHSMFVSGLALSTTILLQVLSNLANDYGDFVKGTDNEQRIGPARAMQQGAITKSEMQKALYVFVGLSLISGIALLYLAFGKEQIWIALGFLLLGIGAIYAAIKYTVGKSAYGYKGLGDVFVFIFFGLVGVLGSYFLHTKTLDPLLILPATTLGAFSAGVLNLNNLRDHENDKNSGKITLAVRLGFQGGKRYHIILVFLGMLAALSYSLINLHSPYQLLYLILFVPVLLHLRFVWKTKEPKRLDPELKKLALITFAFSLIYGLCLNINLFV